MRKHGCSSSSNYTPGTPDLSNNPLPPPPCNSFLLRMYFPIVTAFTLCFPYSRGPFSFHLRYCLWLKLGWLTSLPQYLNLKVMLAVMSIALNFYTFFTVHLEMLVTHWKSNSPEHRANTRQGKQAHFFSAYEGDIVKLIQHLYSKSPEISSKFH